jgi:hypothetical protein
MDQIGCWFAHTKPFVLPVNGAASGTNCLQKSEMSDGQG